VDNKEIVKEGYDRIAGEYLATRNEEQEDVKLLGELIARLPTGASVLDAGCGAGVPVARILSCHFAVTGVDFSAAQVQMARQLVPEANFICQDITTLIFPDASFDAICSYYAIIHIPRQQHTALLRDFYRLLKPGGLALLCLGANDNPDNVDDYYGATMYWSHYDTATNLQLVGDAGFELIWARLVTDSAFPTAAHLFVLAQKLEMPHIIAGAEETAYDNHHSGSIRGYTPNPRNSYSTTAYDEHDRRFNRANSSSPLRRRV
jgi:SAM-dependent methyltransferase